MRDWGFRIIETETHVYIAEGCRADTPAATAAAAADLRVQFADLPNRCDVDDYLRARPRDPENARTKSREGRDTHTYRSRGRSL